MRSEGEKGQALVLTILALTVLIGVAALIIDLGGGYLMRRSLQDSADAAALAAARELPDTDAAIATGTAYSGVPGAKNEAKNLDAVTAQVTTKCVSIAPCKPVNAVVVDETAQVATHFAQIFGIGTMTVHAHAVACAPCEAKKVNVMLVLDRTGSMCQDSWGRNDPNCTDL